MLLASIPSPSQGVWHIGPFPLRGYALSIIVGIGLAIWISQRRWAARGGETSVIGDMAVWAVPFGLVGGRLYHVITSPAAYFGDGGHPMKAFAVWEGGLGVWGAVALGAVGAYIACRRLKVPLPAVADACAPGIAIAQGVGRLGNWFNQELYGKPTTLPWGLEIDPSHRPAAYIEDPTYHPTFLYELLWDFGVAALVMWADRRFKLGHGRAFGLYVAAYTAGRCWIEYMRIDPAEHILGLRLNVWVSVLVFAGAVIGIVLSARRHPGREAPASLRGAAGGVVADDGNNVVVGGATASDSVDEVGVSEEEPDPDPDATQPAEPDLPSRP